MGVVYMHMVIHPQQVQMAHQYNCAAGKQGKFLEFKKAFWEKGFGPYMESRGQDQASLGPDNILKFAPDVGLDTARLKSDAEGQDCAKRIADDMEELRKFRVSGTPGFFINGKFINGGIPKAQFKIIIDEKLKIAEASGVPASEYYQKEIFGKGEKTFRSKKEPKR